MPGKRKPATKKASTMKGGSKKGGIPRTAPKRKMAMGGKTKKTY